MNICSFQNCGNRARCLGLCRSHYSQHYRGTALRPLQAYVRRETYSETCEFDGCGRKTLAHGLCRGHYAQKKRGHGMRPLGPVFNRGEKTFTHCTVAGCGKEHKAKGFCERHWRVLKNYGLNPEEYDSLLASQAGVCAICRNHCELNENLSVDHDHVTGVVRGLLCDRCNRGIALFREDNETLVRAIRYLATRGITKASA